MAPRKKKHHQPPAWLFAAAAHRVHLTRERELSAKTRFHYEMQTRWRTFRDGISSYFGRNFLQHQPALTEDLFNADGEREARPIKLAPVWDLTYAKLLNTAGVFDEALNEQVDDAGDLLDGYQDEIDQSAQDGYATGLWLISQQGVDVSQSKGHGLSALQLAGIAAFGGVSFRDRADRWLVDYQDKATRNFAASMVSGETLDETLGTLDAINNQTQANLAGLIAEELYFAYVAGTDAAVDLYAGELDGELWVTAADEKVCPVCAPLHLTITPLIPISDTHPNCRCWKIPLSSAGLYAPSVYETFVDAMNLDDFIDPTDVDDAMFDELSGE